MKIIPDEEGICVIPFGTKKICENDIQNRQDVRGVIIPDTVNIIDKQSFKGCINLLGAYIPHSVSWIGDFAFDGCIRMKSICFLSDLEKSGSGNILSSETDKPVCSKNSFSPLFSSSCTIGKCAFKDCVMLSIAKLQCKTEYIISDGAFLNCRSLTSLVIPDIESIVFGEDVFFGCTEFKQLIIENGTGDYQCFRRTKEENKYDRLLSTVHKSLYKTGVNIRTFFPVFEGCHHSDGGMEVIYFDDGILKKACVSLTKTGNSFSPDSDTAQEMSSGYLPECSGAGLCAIRTACSNSYTSSITGSSDYVLPMSKSAYYDDDMYEEQFENGGYVIRERVNFKKLKETYSMPACDDSFSGGSCYSCDLSDPRL